MILADKSTDQARVFMTHLHLLVIEFISWGPNFQHMSLLGENFMCLNIYRKMNVCGRAYVIPSAFRLSHLLVELSQIMRPVVRYQRYKLKIVPINSVSLTQATISWEGSLYFVFIYLCVWVFCLHGHVCTTWMLGAQREQKVHRRLLDPLELDSR